MQWREREMTAWPWEGQARQQRLPEKARLPFTLPYKHWKGVEEPQALP